jgi:hypothetical protein
VEVHGKDSFFPFSFFLCFFSILEEADCFASHVAFGQK